MKRKSLLGLLAIMLFVITVAACNITAKFKLTFIVDGKLYATIDTNGGETISMPENPVKNDYVFDGWYWDKDVWQRPFTASSLLNEKLTSSMSVYAKWIEEDVTKRSYTVTFNSMGGSYVDGVTVKHGNLIPEPQKPTKTGYVLAGWYKQADMSDEWNFKTDAVTEDITLYAKWVTEADATACDILTAEGFEINENTLTITVDNSQEHLALSALITVSPYATWNVSSDISGNTVIPSATVSLKAGDNTYYINVTSGNGSNKKQYTVNIHRTAVYTVTYRPNNGESVLTESVEEGNTAQGKTVIKTGYTFKEWQHNGVVWDFETEITGDITLEAVWDANDYEVTFDSNSGNDIQKKTVSYDAEFTFEVLEKTGYTFKGWKTKDGDLLTNGAGKGLAVWDIAENITVYADWEIVEYTITYNNVENATHTNTDKYTVEQEDITLTPATKLGYDFKGWFTEQECENQVQTIEVSQAENVTLWAKWEATKYTATFKAGDGEEQQVEFTIEMEALEEPPVPQKNGYTGEWEDYTIKPQDITINAVYTVIEYNIIYKDTKDAKNTNPDTYNIEDDTFELLPLEATGYKFSGWYDENGPVTQITQGSFGEKTLTAHWELVNYKLNLEYDETIGEYADGQNPTEYNIESNFTLKPLSIKVEGYTFLGWFTAKNDGDGQKIEAITPGRTGELTLYAHYGLKVYTITYHNVEGIENTNTTNYTIKSEPITITEVSKTGYSFDGWYSDAQFNNKANTVIETGSHGNLDFYAKWSLIHYAIDYKLYDGHYNDDESNPASYTITDSFELKSPVKEKYVFDGWYDNTEGGKKITAITAGMTGNLVLYARWIYVSTITFDTDGGSHVDSISNPAGSKVSTPDTIPQKDHYIFDGWYEDVSREREYQFTVMPETDITVYAKWTPEQYRIIYNLDDGQNSGDNPEYYTYESEFEFAEPTKTGYSFIGWFKNGDYTEQIKGVNKGSFGGLTVWARFKINEYTITFQSEGGTSVEAITQNYATQVEEPEAPAKNGYKFAGWYTEKGLVHKYEFTTMPAESITLWAKWDVVDYEIKYNLAGGDNNPANPAKYNIESKTIQLAAPTKRGYTFVAWYSDAGFQTQITEITAGSFGEKEVFAKWQIDTYEITYVLPEGAVNGNIKSYNVETPLTELLDAELKGHRFDGWFTSDEYADNEKVTQIAGGEIGERTLYAKFTANTYTVYLDGTDEATCLVSFDLNGAEGNAPAAQTVTESNVLRYPEIPERQNYLFAGWYANKECSGDPFDFTSIIAQDITLFAKWIELGEATAIEVGGTAQVKLNGKEEQIYRFVPLVSGNVTITATGTADTLGLLYYKETLLKQDDDSGKNGNFLIVYNVTAGEMYEIRIRGFSSTASETVTLSITSESSVADGGHTQTGNKTEITFGDDKFTLSVPTRGELEKFLGWADIDGVFYTDKQGNAVKAWDKDSTTVLYSQWEKMEYTVTFITNGGTDVNESNSVKLEYGARLDVNSYFTTKAGQTFLGWFASLSDSQPYNASTMPDHDLVLQAKWTAYQLGEIKIDEAKLAVKETDEITADLFSAICIDSNGQPAEISVSFTGTKEAGQTITVVFIAQAEGAQPKRKTLSNVKVYGLPTLEVTKTDKDFINLTDQLTGSLFGASGKDTYGSATQIKVLIDGDYSAGQIVTVVIQSIDPAGNITEQRIENVKVYGAPVITYNEQKTGISVNDSLSSELFSATAQDSFGQSVEVKVTRQSGTISAGNTVTIRLSATDIHGNVTNIDLSIKVYGTPTINAPTKTDFKVEEEITPQSLGLTATDTYNQPLQITLEKSEGEQVAGATLTYTATVTDVTGNKQTRQITVKIYGTPTITVGRTAVKDTETVDANVLKATAKDSFNQSLEVTVTLSSGEFAGGNTVYYTITATDKLGNVKTLENVAVKVYSQEAIKLTYLGGASQIVKLSSHGEEFSATATDSFGETCTITLETSAGKPLTAGTTTSLYIVATDTAGNFKKSELISDIKVYGMPTLVLYPEFVYSTTDFTSLSTEFKVIDSFGEELWFEIEVEGTVAEQEHITVTVTATDEAGNTLIKELGYVVGHSAHEKAAEWTTDVTPTCSALGHRYKACTVCGKIMEEEDIEMLPHTWKVSPTEKTKKVCSICGAEEYIYTKSEDGTKIYFGEYPQTEVKESGLKGFLGMEAGANPTSSNAGKWTDYGYYISGSVQSYMWYIDVEYQGGRYRGVYFTSYRPHYTTSSSSTGNSYQDDNGYKTNTVYWFKYEPIEWRILEQKDGTALLMANIILDSQQYYRTTSGTRTVNGKTVYPNNYKESDIRAWLTETFYETAFDELAQQIIETTTVDNSASTTSSSSNSYACENTQDKVFLLSWKEILNTSYGFSSSYSTYDTARRLKSTDYAKSQGCWQSTNSSYRGFRPAGWWWLRSPYYSYGSDAGSVHGDGGAYGGNFVYYTYGGVVPALRIRL